VERNELIGDQRKLTDGKRYDDNEHHPRHTRRQSLPPPVNARRPRPLAHEPRGYAPDGIRALGPAARLVLHCIGRSTVNPSYEESIEDGDHQER